MSADSEKESEMGSAPSPIKNLSPDLSDVVSSSKNNEEKNPGWRTMRICKKILNTPSTVA